MTPAYQREEGHQMVTIFEKYCKQCGHIWWELSMQPRPRRCPACQSTEWNTKKAKAK